METAIALLAFALLTSVGLIGPKVKENHDRADRAEAKVAALEADRARACPAPSAKSALDAVRAAVERDEATRKLYTKETK